MYFFLLQCKIWFYLAFELLNKNVWNIIHEFSVLNKSQYIIFLFIEYRERQKRDFLILFLKCDFKKSNAQLSAGKYFKIRWQFNISFLRMLKDDLMIASNRREKVPFSKPHISLFNIKPWFSNQFLSMIFQPHSRVFWEEEGPCELVDAVVLTCALSLPVSPENSQWLFKYMHYIISTLCFKIVSFFVLFLCVGEVCLLAFYLT